MKTNQEEPKCKKCWDKGYSTEYVGAAYAMPDFAGDKKYKVSEAGIEIHYCTCEKGKKMNPETNQEEWEKEFDELLAYIDSTANRPTTTSLLKDFIRQTLSTEREKAYQEGKMDRFINTWGITEWEMAGNKYGYIKEIQQQTKSQLIKEIEEWVEEEKTSEGYGYFVCYDDLIKYLNTLK